MLLMVNSSIIDVVFPYSSLLAQMYHILVRYVSARVFEKCILEVAVERAVLPVSLGLSQCPPVPVE